MYKKRTISLLAAYTYNKRVIGNQGKIPWNLPSERTRFKQICNNQKVIMGRKTFEEIGHALPYCTIVIISKTLGVCPPGCLLFSSLKKAIKSIDSQVLIAGGEQIYRKTIKWADKIYATEIFSDFEGDAFFPSLSKHWKKTITEQKEENGIRYDYVTFEKR